MKKTPLYETHVKYGGKIIDFSGWALPVQYTGILQEHERVRNAAGLFDVSHMGEIAVRGRTATAFLQGLITNDLSKTADFQAVYSPMCYPDGGTVDDLVIYKFSDDDYLLVVNAANTEKDFSWLLANRREDVEIENVSDAYAQLALQGPKASTILQKLVSEPLSEIGFFRFRSGVDVGGRKMLLSRTGYTGEDGFELYMKPEDAQEVWEMLMEAGKDEGLVPAGLGARDTLRFEAALPLYGQELSESISPVEAGLDRFVKLDKGDYIGREVLQRQKQSGVTRKLCGFEMVDRGVPRSHYQVLGQGQNIGFVTTGGFSPTLGKNIGLALIDIGYSTPGTEVDVVIREKALRARIIGIPFYTRHRKK